MMLDSNDTDMAHQTDSLSSEWATLCATRKEELEVAADQMNRAMIELRDAARIYREVFQPLGVELDYGLLAVTINELECLINDC